MVNKIGEIKGKNFLLLQGPVGFFFKKLTVQFKAKGANVYRIGLNAGDSFFSISENYTPYKGKPEDWYAFIYDYLQEHKIDKIFVFGDCRFYQSVAVGASNQLGVEVYVFEEGYLRPHYITLERHGVNDYSRISRDPSFYEQIHIKELSEPLPSTPNAVCNWSIVMAYYFIARAGHILYPYYTHHRSFSAIQEFFFGLRSLVRKVLYKKRDNSYLPKIKNELSKKYFFVPLQTHNDFQILQHSGYGSVEKFIIEVLESFAKHTEIELLIFKHHPIDRGRRHYKKFILEQAELLGVNQRVLVVHDLHLPTLLKHAKGTVNINSTVGLSSVLCGTPTITLGKAIYDMEGLTSKGMHLDDFWTNYQVPDMEFANKFKQHLIETTQLNGSFYGRMPEELI